MGTVGSHRKQFRTMPPNEMYMSNEHYQASHTTVKLCNMPTHLQDPPRVT
jgi:hypothetical protein